jgi:hypothetical protein
MFRLFSSHASPVPISLIPEPYKSPANPHLKDLIEPLISTLKSCIQDLPFIDYSIKNPVTPTERVVKETRKRPSQKKRLVLYKQKRGELAIPMRKAVSWKSVGAWKKKEYVGGKIEGGRTVGDKVVAEKKPSKRITPVKKAVGPKKDVIQKEAAKKDATKKNVVKKLSPPIKKKESTDQIPEFIHESNDPSSFM